MTVPAHLVDEYCPLCSNLAGHGECPAAKHYVEEDGVAASTDCPCCAECRKKCSAEDEDERVRAADKEFAAYRKASDV